MPWDGQRLWQTLTIMRVYLPSTLPDLAASLRAGQIQAQRGYAVTPALREAYASGDQEELEYVAMLAAARVSLRLLAADPATPPRRVVLAAEIPDAGISAAMAGDAAIGASQKMGSGDDRDPSAVVLTGPVAVADLVSAHVDDQVAEKDVRAAAAALPEADLGDADAQFTVDGAEGHELAWYATQELPDLGRPAT